MLDELIKSKNAEIERTWGLACGTVGNMDGMPHAPGVSDKVGCLVVKLVSLDEELKRYDDQRNAMLDVLQMLPANEYGVLRREYVQYMTQEAIAADMGYSTVQVWRIKKKALKILEKLIN